MGKKKIVHIIDDLGRGGAETMLIDLLPDLSVAYDVILVTLGNKLEFDPAQVVCKERISLNYKGTSDILRASRQLKGIIKQCQPDIIRSQLYWSTIVARQACSKGIPFYFSVHATLNEDPIAFYKRLFINTLEKVTYKHWQNMIGVTQAVIDSFIQMHPHHGKTFLLHNFVRDHFFKQSYEVKYDGVAPLRLVTVSNLRVIKNIPYLVEAIKLLPPHSVTLDIYGDGPVRHTIAALINKYNLKNIRLLGKRPDIHNVLHAYDIFISPSTVEGFGIAVAEAMSVGLPVIISDIPVYREIGADKALYLNNKDPDSLQRIIHSVLQGGINLKELSDANKMHALKTFSKQGYLSKLNAIYQTS